MIITIDGPAASGKSSIARRIAEEYDACLLMTGYLYRALSYGLIIEENQTVDSINSCDQATLSELIRTALSYTYTKREGVAVFWRDRNITPFLKRASVAESASQLSSLPVIRQALLEYQRLFAKDRTVVAEGRDCGTVVFPGASHKFFITASDDIRAQRWYDDHRVTETNLTLERARTELQARDVRDKERTIAPLKPAQDAQVIDTSELSISQAVDLVCRSIDGV